MGLSAPPPHFWGGEFKKHVLEAKKILGRHYEVTKSLKQGMASFLLGS